MIRRQTVAGELGVGGLQKNPLLLDAEQRDLLDALDGVVGVAEALGDLVHLGEREAFGRQRDGGDRNIAKVAVDHRAERAFGQFRAHRVHLVPKILPDRLQLEEAVIDRDVDDREAGLGAGRDLLDLGDAAGSLFRACA